MREQIISLIREGLGYPNLEQLIQLCLSLFDTNPVLYDVLGRIFAMLADEYDDQAITVERYESIMQVLQRPLIVALETESASAEVFLAGLNELLRAFKSLPPYRGIQ